MFSKSRNDRRCRIGGHRSPQGSRQRRRPAGIGDNSAEIGDNSAEIGDGAAGIVDIAANEILC